MSWDVELQDEKTKKPVAVANHSEGGTYVLGGTPTAELNVTYNYSKVLREVWDGESLGFLHGKKASRVTKLLEDSVKVLGTERDDDYWKATEGNVGFALNTLLVWAKANPDAVFEVV